MAIEVNGSRKIVVLILVKRESQEVSLPVVNKFRNQAWEKGRNQAWLKAVVIISGKRFYRTVLAFPK